MLAGRGLAAAEVSGGWDLANATPLSKVLSFSVSAQDGSSTGLYFSTDGTRLYVIGSASDAVYQYDLGTAWDITTASYSSISFSVAAQETTPQSLSFKPDGLVMYVIGYATDAVYQYTLSTAWDISTASYASKSFSVVAQETASRGFFLKPDGTAMYVVGSATDTVYQYTLSTAWDVSTASYASKSFSVAAQDTAPNGVFFNPSGTAMFMVGDVTGNLYQYKLSTAWDVSTAAYIARSITLPVISSDFFIRSDGGVIYLVSDATDVVYQYPMDAAWNIASVSYTAREFYTVAQQATGLTGIFMSSDGTYMYATGNVNDTVYQYALAIPGQIYTAFYTGNSFYVGSQETNPYGLFFKPDGTAMYLVGRAGDTVFQYTLSTAWDISTASYASKSFSVAGQETNPSGLFFKPDGTAMYVTGVTTDTVYQYTLTTAWDVSTASYASKNRAVAFVDTNPQTISFKPDGTVMYLLGSTGDSVYVFTLSTAWDLSTSAYSFISLSVAAQATVPTGLFIDSTGTSMYIADNSTNKVSQYTLPTAWSVVQGWNQRVGLGTYYNSAVVTAQDSGPGDVAFNTDGTAMYVVGSTSDVIYQYTLDTPWDVSTAWYGGKSFSVTTQDPNPEGLFFKPDGTAVYIIGTTNDRVFQYTLSTAWDISTASYSSKNVSVISQESNPFGVFFNPDGTAMYVVGSINDTVYQYTLSTAWDVSTASYASLSLSVSAQDSAPTSLFFKTDGTALYVVGRGTAPYSVYQYNLGTPWDVGTGSYSGISYSVAAFDTSPEGVAFSMLGDRMYITGDGSNTIYQFNTQ